MNTAKLPVLTEDRKRVLIRRAQAGDEDARQEMVCGNLRLVLSVVQKFSARGEELDDLFQVGCIGLIKAIDNFDTSLGLRFSTYGQPMIAGEIRRFLNPVENGVEFGKQSRIATRRSGSLGTRAAEQARPSGKSHRPATGK